MRNIKKSFQNARRDGIIIFRCRAGRVLSRILEESSGMKTVAIVSHGGMINRLCQTLLRLPIDNDLVFPTDDTGVHGWRLEGRRRTLLFANRTAHLQNTF